MLDWLIFLLICINFVRKFGHGIELTKFAPSTGTKNVTIQLRIKKL